jgi:hypothetical protein
MKLNTSILSLAVASVAFGLTLAPANPAFAAQTKPLMAQSSSAMMTAKSSAFKGIEVNGGTVSFSMKNGKGMLELSSDFKIPNTPAPHWQIVDGQGNSYLLNQLKIKDDMTNRSITLPSYIKSIKKVQIWCSFVEVNLGEAMFTKTVMVK